MSVLAPAPSLKAALAAAPGDRLLTVQQVAARLGVGVRTLWRLVEHKRAPQPIRFSSKLVRWHSAVVQAFLDGLRADAAPAKD